MKYLLKNSYSGQVHRHQVAEHFRSLARRELWTELALVIISSFLFWLFISLVLINK